MVTPSRILRILLVCSLWLPAGAQDEGLEWLLFQDIEPIFTASKTEQTIERATSIVTVIEAEQIERWGVRTLYEVLKRVPGFFASAQATWTLTACRGLTSDGNDHVLLLIDGHAQNSIVGQGYQQQDMLPTLEKVKRIEIIRGPGAVLWGSSAVMGIINIITKDGSDLPANEITVGYGDRDGMFSVNWLHALTLEEADASGVISLSYWESEGYNRPDRAGTGAAWSPEAADSIQSNVEFPWGKIADWPAIDRHREGWELYAKAKLGARHELLARVAESRVVYPWDTWLENPGSDLTMRKAYLSYRHAAELGQKTNLSMLVYGDLLLQNRFPYCEELFKSGAGGNRDHMQDQSNEERAFGAEVTGKISITEANQATVGLKATRVRVGPNRDARFNITENIPSSLEYPHIGVESGYDNTLAAYGEDIWNFNESRTTLFAGARVEYNDFREEGTIFLPRGGLIQSLGERWTTKYVFNSGYLRPNAVYSKTAGIIVDENRGPNQDFLVVEESEQVANHEIQLYWESGAHRIGANAFYMQIDNYISFDANNVPQGYKNLGDASSVGLELEATMHFRNAIEFYANYSFVQAELENSAHQGALTDNDNQTLNYPEHMFNLGGTWLFGRRHSLNINLNGWRCMHIVLPLNSAGTAGQFDHLEGENYVDVSLDFRRVLASPVNLTIFGTNLFNNTDAIGMIVNNGLWYPRGRNVGMDFSYEW